jgi:hypothetical protein
MVVGMGFVSLMDSVCDWRSFGDSFGSYRGDDEMKGILIDDTGDLMVRRGTLAIGDCDNDIAERLIRAWQGEFKENPLLGGNIDKMINGAVDPFWRGEMMTQMKSQHLAVKRLDISEAGIGVELN